MSQYGPNKGRDTQHNDNRATGSRTLADPAMMAGAITLGALAFLIILNRGFGPVIQPA